ncbi:MAG: YgaP-like transmembrane domain [Sphingomicrobium sp.]
MVKNVGSSDRLFRVVVGVALVALIYLAPLTGTAALIAGIAAIALLLSAMFSRSLIYKLAGIDTTTEEAPYSTTDDRAGL